MPRKFVWVVPFSLFVLVGCDGNDAACLPTGDQSCIDWSGGQDAYVIHYPSDQSGAGLVALTPDGLRLDGRKSFVDRANSVIEQGGSFVAFGEDPYGVSSTPQSHPMGTVVSQDPWIMVTQDASHDKQVNGCVGGRFADFVRNTRITLNGQHSPLLDIHWALFHDEDGNACWGLYESGTDSSGPGVCYCNDENDPPPTEAVESAVYDELQDIRPPGIDYFIWTLASSVEIETVESYLWMLALAA